MMCIRGALYPILCFFVIGVVVVVVVEVIEEFVTCSVFVCMDVHSAALLSDATRNVVLCVASYDSDRDALRRVVQAMIGWIIYSAADARLLCR